MRFRRPLLSLFALAVVGLPACQPTAGRKPTFPVAGKVLINGKPAEHATVVLHPVGGGSDDVKARGKVAADGSFKLTTYDADDGAPAGDYRVTVELYLAGRPDEGPSNRLPAKFSKPETSGLTATVASGPTELKPIELKR